MDSRVVGATVARRLYRVPEVAQMCGTTARSVYAWIAGGRLAVVRISRRCVRVEAAELERFLAAARAGRATA